MPAKSKAQQKFMGMVHAAQKGDKAASAKVAKVAKRMKKKDAEDYASTKHKGKPEHVPKKEEVSVNIDKLLKNPKIKKIMQKLDIKKAQSKDAALKILNYFAVNPHALVALKKMAFGETVDESGILYKAGVKKYGKEGMAKILSAAGKKKSHAEIGAIKDKYEKDKKESVKESDLGLTYKKGKTVKVTHKKSGKELVIIDKPNVKREYEKIGYFAEGQVNELSMAPFSSQEARLHIDADIKKMSKELGKTSHDIIKIMMDGVKRGRYTAMDIARGIKEGPAGRTHFGEMTFIQSLWNKVREKFRRYSKDRKLS